MTGVILLVLFALAGPEALVIAGVLAGAMLALEAFGVTLPYATGHAALYDASVVFLGIVAWAAIVAFREARRSQPKEHRL